jgi:hypothetical protein
LAHEKHGKAYSSEYFRWSAMKARCYNPNSKLYRLYGARGITVCAEWLESFSNFYKDMGDCPKGYSLDRINVNEGYSKANCRWASNLEQGNNRQIHIERGYSVTGLAKETGFVQSTLSNRLLRGGYSLEEALVNKPYESNKPFSTSTTGIRGIYYNKTKNKWTAKFTFKKERIFVGEFKDKEQAIVALNAKRESVGLRAIT